MSREGPFLLRLGAFGRDSSWRGGERGGAGAAHLHELPAALARALIRCLVQRVEEGRGRVVRDRLLRLRLHRELVEHLQRLDEVELPGRVRGDAVAHALDPSLDHVRARAWLAPGAKWGACALASLRPGALSRALASRALAHRWWGRADGCGSGRGRLPRLRGIGTPRSRLRRRRASGGRGSGCGCRGSRCGCRRGDNGGLRLFLRLAHVQVLDIVAAENDIIKDVDGRGDGVVWLAVLRPIGAHFLERHSGVVGVDRVQRALIADLGLRDEHDAGAQVRHAHGAGGSEGRACVWRGPARQTKLGSKGARAF